MDWEQVYLAHRPAMLDVAARRVQDRPDLDATDVVQEVFASLLADPPETPPDRGVLLARLAAVVPVGRGAPPVQEVPHEEDTAVVVVRRVAAEELRGRIQRVMGYMTERQRVITRLRLFEGLSVGEIATLIGTSSSNVSQIIIRCLAKLGPSLLRCDGFGEQDLEQLRPSRRVLTPRPSTPLPAEDRAHRPETMLIPAARRPSPSPDPSRTPAPGVQPISVSSTKATRPRAPVAGSQRHPSCRP